MVNYDKNNSFEPDIKEFYREINGLKLPIHIFNPKVKNEKNEYVVICIHGGAWKTGIKVDTEWQGGDMIHQAKIFSLLGYTGVAISYRCLTNPKTDITDLVDDCRKAILYVKERLNVDNNHIILIGDSAGAHLATCIGISDDDNVRPEIVISCNPVLDCTKNFAYASEDENIRKWASPLFRDINKCSKFLFIHGDTDLTTPYSDTVKMNESLNKMGFESELITLKNVMHAFILYNYRSTDKEVENYMEMIEEYLNKKIHLKGNE